MKKAIVFLLALAFCALVVWVIQGNVSLSTAAYTVVSDRLPQSFDGFLIAQVSDLHNASFGEDNARLIGMLADAQPDLIAITGDLIDSRRTDVAVALSFADRASQIAPTYFVSGNHDVARAAEYAALKDGLTRLGVSVLENASICIERNGESIALLGLHDPALYPRTDRLERLGNELEQMLPQDNSYTLLLAHRPEHFDIYTAHAVDLALCGHAHGGQFVLPWFGGVYAPGQGLFPEYDAGQFASGQTQMIVSRGLGNSLFPFRVNNPPEVVFVTLRAG